VISLIDGGWQTAIKEEIEPAFKQGLIEAAKLTNTWIISGGANYGVMKLVGDAVSEDLHARDSLTLLGIASWNCIADTVKDIQVCISNKKKTIMRTILVLG
jgi:hypothetical protein